MDSKNVLAVCLSKRGQRYIKCVYNFMKMTDNCI